MLQKLIHTNSGDRNALIARVALGVVILPHGLQKLLGMFGGAGFSGTMDFFTGTLGVPAVFVFLIIMAESFGALGLIAGILTRFTAAGITLVMLGAVFMMHWQNGFFMNWFGIEGQGHGFEYHLLAIGLGIICTVAGGGKWSLDVKLSERLSSAQDVKVVEESEMKETA
ncbi:MAG: DoxX family protein [bacterium]